MSDKAQKSALRDRIALHLTVGLVTATKIAQTAKDLTIAGTLETRIAAKEIKDQVSFGYKIGYEIVQEERKARLAEIDNKRARLAALKKAVAKVEETTKTEAEVKPKPSIKNVIKGTVIKTNSV